MEFRSISRSILGEGTQGEQASLFGGAVGVAQEAPVEIVKNNLDNSEHDYILADTDAEIDKLVAKLKAESLYCFDTETTGLDAHSVELVGLAFSWGPETLLCPDTRRSAYRS